MRNLQDSFPRLISHQKKKQMVRVRSNNCVAEHFERQQSILACQIKLEGKFLLNGMIGSAAKRTAQFHLQFEVKQSQEIIPLCIYKEELNPSQCNVAPDRNKQTMISVLDTA